MQKYSTMGGMEIRGEPYEWNKSYLTNLSQNIILDNNRSHPLKCKVGVPQGSVLRSILLSFSLLTLIEPAKLLIE